jgi:hypothetical protein
MRTPHKLKASLLTSWSVVAWTLLNSAWLTESESYVTTDGQPASLSWNKAPFWDLRPDLYYCLDSCGFVDLGRPLWREDGSVVGNCYWPSPAQSFSGPSPAGLVAIFYCLFWDFPFHHLLWLAGSRWGYSTPPPAWLTHCQSVCYLR